MGTCCCIAVGITIRYCSSHCSTGSSCLQVVTSYLSSCKITTGIHFVVIAWETFSSSRIAAACVCCTLCSIPIESIRTLRACTRTRLNAVSHSAASIRWSKIITSWTLWAGCGAGICFTISDSCCYGCTNTAWKIIVTRATTTFWSCWIPWSITVGRNNASQLICIRSVATKTYRAFWSSTGDCACSALVND